MPSAKTLHLLQSRHSRRKAGLCLVEGLRCVREALNLLPDAVSELFCTGKFLDDGYAESLGCSRNRLAQISDGEFLSISETENSQGILALVKIPEFPKPTLLPKPFALILDRVADPGNLGTILRTCWAIGLNDVWLVKGCADPWSPKVVRAGMGAQFAVRTHQFDTLDEAVKTSKQMGAEHIWCTLPDRGISIFDPSFRLPGSALIIGNEANGISDPDIGEAVTIPMPGHAESLNAAQAATVFLINSLKTN